MNLKAFNEHLTDWLTFLEVEKNVSIHTLLAYKRDMGQLTTFWEKLEREEPNVPHPFDGIIRRYVMTLFYKKVAASTLARKLSCIRSMQKYLAGQGITFTFNIKAPRQEKRLPVVLSVDEIFYLLDDVKSGDLPTKYPCRDKSIFELLYASGIRCSELTNLKVTDIDFAGKSLRVMGKGRKMRIALFGDRALKALEEYMHVERGVLSKGQENEFMFLNGTNGNQITSRSVQRILEMFRRFLKIERKLTPHKLRHSFATHLLNQGVDLRVVKELLGHETMATTEIYTHVTNADLAQMCDEKHPLNDLED